MTAEEAKAAVLARYPKATCKQSGATAGGVFNMQAISLWQPWATLLANGEKKIETRSWPIKGPFPRVLAIHAAKKWTRELHQLCHQEPFRTSLIACGHGNDQGYVYAPGLPKGVIVGMVRVVACESTNQGLFIPALLKLSEKEIAFGDYHTNRFAWICDQFFKLPNQEPCIGRQGFFQWESPAGVTLPDWCAGRGSV